MKNMFWFKYDKSCKIFIYNTHTCEIFTKFWIGWQCLLLCCHFSLADGKWWLCGCLLSKMDLNNPSISASSCGRAGWAPAVTLSLPRQKTNFFLELSKPRCNLMMGKFLRLSGWQLLTSSLNDTLLKFTSRAPISSSSVIPVSTPHLISPSAASLWHNGCCIDSFTSRKTDTDTLDSYFRLIQIHPFWQAFLSTFINEWTQWTFLSCF